MSPKTIGSVASLTGHLAKASNPVRSFLMEVLPSPTAKPYQDALKEALRAGPRIVGSGLLPWEHALIGTAFDYRARFSLAITPANELIAAMGVATLQSYLVDEEDGGFEFFMGCQSFIEETDSAVIRIAPVGRRLEPTDEELLDRHCVVLALLEQVARVGLRPGSPLVTRPLACTTPALLALARPPWVNDLREMAWQFDDCIWRENLLGRPALLNPTFAGSSDLHGADADLIVDGCLIEIKSTTQSTFRDPVIHQLLGYVLLDYENALGINSVAVYLARHGIFLKWPLVGLLGKDADRANLTALRSRFRTLLRSPLGSGVVVASH